jgi:chromosome segregation ATPase
MPLKAMKRKAAGQKAGSVAKKCRTLLPTIRDADIPQPVRSMLKDSLVRTFSTYKEDRHPLQKEMSELVASVLNGTQRKLQGAITEAQQKKAALEAEAATLTAANDAAQGASEAAATAFADSKTVLADSKTALKDAKTALHDLEAAAKHAESESVATAAKKQKLETVIADTITAVREGTKHGAAAGKHVGSVLGSSLETEFLGCVTTTFSKAGSAWGTFDHIVDKRLEETLKNLVAGLAADLEKNASEKETCAAKIEAAKGAVAAAVEKEKAMEEACTNTASEEAKTAAKATAAALKPHQQQIQKAADAITHAEAALAAFQAGPLAAYAEVEAHTAPPPPPEPVETAGASIEAAMDPAPAPAAKKAPTILPSPGVLSWIGQASGLAASPRVAATPQVA